MIGSDGTKYQPTDQPILTISPKQMTFELSLDQTVAANTLSGIQITRAGPDGLFGINPKTHLDDDIVIQPGWSGIGDQPNEVVVRFAQDLPSDQYCVTFVGQNRYFGSDGKVVAPLENTAGVYFRANATTPTAGQNRTWDFQLEAAPQVVAVVPQPTIETNGTITQLRNVIEVDFTPGDQMQTLTTPPPVTDPITNVVTGKLDQTFFQLIATKGTADTGDDGPPIIPTDVSYTFNAAAGVNKAVLTFADTVHPVADLADLGTGSFRLRIGNQYQTIATKPLTNVDGLGNEAGSSFGAPDTDVNSKLGGGAPQSIVFSGSIDPQLYPLQFPGGTDVPGSRDLPSDVNMDGQSNYGTTPSGDSPIAVTKTYCFPATYVGNNGVTYPDLITEAQKESARGIFTLLESYCGVKFEETTTPDSSTIRLIVGDPAAYGNGGAVFMWSNNWTLLNNTFYSNDSGQFGGAFMTRPCTASWLTWGRAKPTTRPLSRRMAAEPTRPARPPADAVYPGDVDIVTLQALYRPANLDIDLYQFTLDAAGTFSTETIAQRLVDEGLATSPSLLNTALTLFDANYNVVARNDDYFGTDSFIQIHLAAGTYYIGVSAKGNNVYDPTSPIAGWAVSRREPMSYG